MKITLIFACSEMFRNVPECSGMFHVPGFIDAQVEIASVVRTSTVCGRERMYELCGFVYSKGHQKSPETPREI